MEPMYRQEGNQWIPSDYTIGPYPGSQHGGPVAAALMARVEAQAAELNAGQAMMISICQLRPAPILPAEITTGIIRDGRRSSFLEGTISFEGKPTAKATAIFAKPLEVPTLPEPPRETHLPESLEILELPFIKQDRSYGACLDIRKSEKNIIWIRLNRPALEGQSDLVNLMALVDMSPGVSLIAKGIDFRSLFQGFPTLDLTVHLTRPPEGEWVGFESTSTYYNHGLGMTETALHDRNGPLGRIAQSFVILPNPS